MTNKQKKMFAKANMERIKQIRKRVTGVPSASYDIPTLKRCCIETIIRRRIVDPKDGREIYCDKSKEIFYNTAKYCDCKITYSKNGDYWYGDNGMQKSTIKKP